MSKSCDFMNNKTDADQPSSVLAYHGPFRIDYSAASNMINISKQPTGLIQKTNFCEYQLLRQLDNITKNIDIVDETRDGRSMAFINVPSCVSNKISIIEQEISSAIPKDVPSQAHVWINANFNDSNDEDTVLNLGDLSSRLFDGFMYAGDVSIVGNFIADRLGWKHMIHHGDINITCNTIHDFSDLPICINGYLSIFNKMVIDCASMCKRLKVVSKFLMISSACTSLASLMMLTIGGNISIYSSKTCQFKIPDGKIDAVNELLNRHKNKGRVGYMAFVKDMNDIGLQAFA